MTDTMISAERIADRSFWMGPRKGWLGGLDRWGTANRGSFLCATAAFLALLLFLRHPGGLLDANFWAEDGWVWYPESYSLGVLSLFRPHSGYLQTFSRLIALASQPFPLPWAPTIFASAAFLVRLLPPLLLLSRRLDAAWPDLMSRLLLATIYICLPNSFEEFANVTNSQWHLALVGFLLVTASPPSKPAGRVTDLMVLTLCGLSGPFCLMLLPIAGWAWLKTRSPATRDRFVCMAICATVQGCLLVLTAAETRSTATLGIGFVALARIFAVQVELGLMLGAHVTSRLARMGLFQWAPVVVFLTIAGLAACALATWKGCDLLRKFALFGSLVFTASLISPVVSLDAPAWVTLATPGAGQRYFLIPMLLFASAGIALASHRKQFLRRSGLFICAIVIVGTAGDWRYPQIRQTNFNNQARRFDLAPVGTEMAFEIHPREAAPMVLTKK